MPKYYSGCPSVVELVIFICFLLISFFFYKFPNELLQKIIAERDLGEDYGNLINSLRSD